MKNQGFPQMGLAMAAALALAFAPGIFAQDTTVAVPTPMNAGATAAPALSPPAAQVLELAQAKISDSTIITYIQNSGTLYGLNASQIVYLKQQGVSEPVLNAMLNQRTVIAATAPPAPEPSGTTTIPDMTATPTATVAQPATPAPSVVVVPDTQTYYYDNWAYPYSYPYYPYYSYPVVIGGWGWGWHGGYSGGWHGGGGFSGGFHSGGGGFSGGFHGGGGGFHH